MVKFPTCRIEWRVLDSQYWGVPQRRKRIFLVADFGTAGRCAGEILFERKSLPGNIAPGGRTGESSAAGIIEGSGTASGAVCLNDQGGQQMNVTHDMTGTLRAEAHHPPPIVAGFSVGASIADNNPVLENLAPTMRTTTRLGCMCAGFTLGQGSKAQGIGYQKEILPTLSAMDGGNKPAVLLYENCTTKSRTKGPLDKSPAITARAGTGGNNLPLLLQEPVFCVGNGQVNQMNQREKARALNCMHDQQCVSITKTEVVRRLTPLECERLQGLPDGWTLIKDKICSDSARYKALGNGMAQPCADWIIKRIVEAMQNSKV